MESSVLTQLQSIRGQIELHDVQWPNRLFDPIGDNVAPWGQLVEGEVAWNAEYLGDYLASPPVNPLQSSSTVAGAPAMTVGWVWADLNGWGVGLYAVDELGAQLDLDGDGNAD